MVDKKGSAFKISRRLVPRRGMIFSHVGVLGSTVHQFVKISDKPTTRTNLSSQNLLNGQVILEVEC